MAGNTKKYKNIEELSKEVESFGFSNVEKDSNKRLIVYIEKVGGIDNRKAALMSLAKQLRGNYVPQRTGNGWKSSVGATRINDYVILAKPSAEGGKGNLSSLDARVFSSFGISGKFDYRGESVEVKIFDSPNRIEKSIIEGCRTNPLLGKDVAEVFKEFFTTGKLSWNRINPQAINKLGVYVGEILVGWVFLKSLEKKHFNKNPFYGSPIKFILPTDPAFSGVDSFIVMSNKKYYSLSSKLGVGAAASLFTNILDKGIKNSSKLNGSVFRDLCQICIAENLSYKESRAIVYNFGIRKLLKISKAKIEDVNSVYEQILSGKLGPEAKMVIESIKKYPGADAPVIKNLPNSVSAFFNREIAKTLNNDSQSLKQMKEILSGKDYWQGNLDAGEWSKGNLNYDWLSSAAAKLEIIGTKGSTEDISSKQGWINYRLSYD